MDPGCSEEPPQGTTAESRANSEAIARKANRRNQGKPAGAEMLAVVESDNKKPSPRSLLTMRRLNPASPQRAQRRD